MFPYIDKYHICITHIHRIFFVFYNIGVFCGFVHWVSSYCNAFFKQRQLPCVSDMALFLRGGTDSRLCDECAMIIWTRYHLLESTAQIVACLRQNLCSVHEAGKLRTCGAELELLGWLTIQLWAFKGGGMAIQPKSSNSASHIRFGGGFPGCATMMN